MSKIIDAESPNNNHEVKGNGKYSFAPKAEKSTACIIDADAQQAAALEVKPRPQPEVIVA